MRRESKFVGVCLAAALTILYKLLTMCAFLLFFLIRIAFDWFHFTRVTHAFPEEASRKRVVKTTPRSWKWNNNRKRKKKKSGNLKTMAFLCCVKFASSQIVKHFATNKVRDRVDDERLWIESTPFLSIYCVFLILFGKEQHMTVNSRQRFTCSTQSKISVYL